MFSFLSKILGDANAGELKKLEPLVEKINKLEPKIKRLSSEELKNKTEEFKKRLEGKETLDDILPEAFACVRESSRRAIGERPFDVQVVCAIALHQGKITEMKTGEGKTLAATMPLYLNALSGKGVHLVTVNDYLAKRDTSWMGPIYYSLGLSCGCIQHEGGFLYDPDYSPEESEKSEDLENKEPKAVDVIDLRPVSRSEAYHADITYGTNNEFGFDYLRDNMVWDLSKRAQQSLHFAIVDEVDSILIDEARTPLIISAPDTESTEKYYQFARIVPKLKENEDYNVDEKMRAVTLTEAGVSKVEDILGVGNIYEQGGIELVHHLEQALRAQVLFKRDKDYVIKGGQVIIVDDFTGRLMFGRRYSEGLHQALEAKEAVEVKRESKTLATITFQNYFRMYRKLSGMTGTAATSAEEFSKVYNLEVVIIPTNKPMIRRDQPDIILKTEEAKFNAVVGEVKKRYKRGQPVLLGTVSIEKNEIIDGLLTQAGVPHQVLNAKNHEEEAQIIAKAGLKSTVTVATNMAGRGTDIKLGKGVVDLGGLFVLGTERHEARRIDNQLRGRSGRQGDPGESQFFVSLEDDLMRIFGGDRIKGVMEALKIPEDQPIENRLISRSIEEAQRKIEGYHFDMRKHVLEYDDVMNKQREVIYKRREKYLRFSYSGKLKREIIRMIKDEITQVVVAHTADLDPEAWDLEEIYEVVNTIFPLPSDAHRELIGKRDEIKAQTRDRLIGYLINLSKEAYAKREEEVTPDTMRQIEKAVLLQSVDTLWVDHLDAMSQLQEGIGLRGYGQQDPLVEYKNEGYRMFGQLLSSIQTQVVYSIFKVGVVMKKASPIKEAQDKGLLKESGSFDDSGTFASGDSSKASSKDSSQEPMRVKKVGRNDPCPCGSGKKYKKCCGRNL